MELLRHIADPIADYFLPRRCVVCSAPALQRRAPVCPRCMLELESRRIPEESRSRLLSVLTTSDAIDDVFGLYAYREEGAIHGIVLAMKYRGGQSLCIRMGKQIGEAVYRSGDAKKIDCLIPVPIHPARLRERRYNQSALLTQGISEAAEIPIARKIIIRTRKTRPQAFLGAQARGENIRDAFSIQRKLVEGKRVGVVDDVVTTGSTVNACAQILKQFGAAHVTVISLAVAQANALLQNHSAEPLEIVEANR